MMSCLASQLTFPPKLAGPELHRRLLWPHRRFTLRSLAPFRKLPVTMDALAYSHRAFHEKKADFIGIGQEWILLSQKLNGECIEPFGLAGSDEAEGSGQRKHDDVLTTIMLACFCSILPAQAPNFFSMSGLPQWGVHRRYLMTSGRCACHGFYYVCTAMLLQGTQKQGSGLVLGDKIFFHSTSKSLPW